MNRRKVMLLVMSMSLLLSGCGSSSSNMSTMSTSDSMSGNFEMAMDSEYAVESNDGDTSSTDVEQQYADKLIYTCNLNMETLTYDDTMSQIKKAISDVKGFVQSESVYTDNYSSNGETRHCSLTVRVPSDQYDAFVKVISQTGSMTNMSSNVDNITQQYYDTETRIKALKIQEDRLLEMLENCDTVTDMITVEDRLSEVQSEMAVYQTDLNLMKKDVAYSTVNIDIDEVVEISVVEDSPFARFAATVKDSMKFFLSVVKEIGTALIYLFPFAIVAGVILLIIHSISKKNKKKKDAKKMDEKSVESTQNTNTDQKK